MKITLNSPFEAFVRKLVEVGRYDSEQQVIEAGIARLVLESLDSGPEELDNSTTAAIARSEEQIRSGSVRSLDDAVAELRKKHFGR